jgi:hypothetical protein
MVTDSMSTRKSARWCRAINAKTGNARQMQGRQTLLVRLDTDGKGGSPVRSDNIGEVREKCDRSIHTGKTGPAGDPIVRSTEITGLCDKGKAAPWCRGIAQIAVYPHIFSLATSRSTHTYTLAGLPVGFSVGYLKRVTVTPA